MTRQLRDIVVSLAALSLLVLLLISINPQLRERAGASLDSKHLESGETVVRHTADVALSWVIRYASGNPYLFVFLVAASVLFIAMLRT